MELQGKSQFALIKQISTGFSCSVKVGRGINNKLGKSKNERRSEDEENRLLEILIVHSENIPNDPVVSVFLLLLENLGWNAGSDCESVMTGKTFQLRVFSLSSSIHPPIPLHLPFPARSDADLRMSETSSC